MGSYRSQRATGVELCSRFFPRPVSLTNFGVTFFDFLQFLIGKLFDVDHVVVRGKCERISSSSLR